MQKAPAATIEDLTMAMKDIYNASNPVQIIGTRHGEKLYETPVTREELHPSPGQCSDYREPRDAWDLNYSEDFEQGDPAENPREDDYHSHNTERLDVDEVVALLRGLPDFRKLVGA